MGPKFWKERLELVTAYANGEEVQYLECPGQPDERWVGSTSLSFTDPVKRYRIKPKPTYRPFKNAQEFLPYANKFVILKGCIGTPAEEHYRINVVNDNMAWFTLTSQNAVRWQRLFDEYTFSDGTPCGVIDTDTKETK